jgi:nucleoside phosphorylase
MPGAARPSVVGLLAPMPSEMRPLAKALGLRRDAGARVARGEIRGIGLVAARTGIGTRNAADATARLLDGHGVEHVVVVGIAGGMGASRVGDVLHPEVVVDKVSGREYRAAPLGDVVPRGRVVTHDDFDMGPDELRRLVDDGFDAVDMETAAIAAACEARGCPWSAVRAISDLVGVTPGDVITLANPDGSPNVGASLRYLLRKPWRVPALVRLGRDATRAARAAAAETRRVLEAAG